MSKLKVLVHTKPLADGLGDIYSAYRMKLLLEEQNPNWDVKLHLESVTNRRPNDKVDIDYLNKIGQELSTINQNDAVEFRPDALIRVCGCISEESDFPLLFQYKTPIYDKIPSKALIHAPVIYEVPEYCAATDLSNVFMNVAKS